MIVNKILHKTFNHFGYKIVAKKPKTDATSELKDLFGIELPPNIYYYCHKGWKLLRDLKIAYSATLMINDKNILEISFSKYVFAINTWEEILVLHEIFVQGVYNLELKKDFLFIDIGMNVGFTSIYFSSQEYCKNVIAFEPFKNTIDSARYNMFLNPTFSGAIEIFNIGLGYPKRDLEVEYSNNHKGSVGINGIAPYVEGIAPRFKVELAIVDVAETLKSFLATPNIKKVMKIDCEGAEYEIINRLAETKLLNSVDILMIEWPMKGPEEIKGYLSNAGFTTFSFNEFSKTIGMLYAFKPR